MSEQSDAAQNGGTYSGAVSRIRTRVGEVELANLGESAGPALLLLPHGLSDWSSLFDIALALSNASPGLRVIALSRPVHGEAARESDDDSLSYEAGVFLPAVMDALEIPCANFIGHADGATVALLFAGLFPERVRGIVGLAPYGFGDDYLRMALESIPLPECRPEQLMKLGESLRDPALVFSRWKAARLSECRRGWSATASFTRISAPVVLVQGMRDEFISLDQATAIAGRLSGQVSWITLKNTGHLIHLDNPEQVIMLAQRQLEPHLDRARVERKANAAVSRPRKNHAKDVTRILPYVRKEPQPIEAGDKAVCFQ
ncbi:MAG: alpha/beta hydrolase [Rhizobiales bacterium]|nr:alpha/beta hydrolase [Hyphomicrobiales bacterium]